MMREAKKPPEAKPLVLPPPIPVADAVPGPFDMAPKFIIPVFPKIKSACVPAPAPSDVPVMTFPVEPPFVIPCAFAVPLPEDAVLLVPSWKLKVDPPTKLFALPVTPVVGEAMIPPLKTAVASPVELASAVPPVMVFPMAPPKNPAFPPTAPLTPPTVKKLGADTCVCRDRNEEES